MTTPTATDLLHHLVRRCTFPPAGEPLTVAVSGGPDSLALLVLAAHAGCRVTAVHVDHGLRPGSHAEAEVVRRVAARVGADFAAHTVHVTPGPNLEARAREARYAVLPADVATGHTLDDQAETILVNLLRGAGLDGLAGMRPGLRHPLLALRRSETRELCDLLELDPVSDPSNEDPAFVRNRIRHEVMPLLADIAGRDVAAVVASQAGVLRADADHLDALAAGLDPTDAGVLAAAPLPLARRAVRSWVRDVTGHPPSRAAVERILDVARGDAVATEIEGGLRVARTAGNLRIG